MTALLAMTRRVFLAGAAALPFTPARPRHRTCYFTVQVTDAAGNVATRPLSITVRR